MEINAGSQMALECTAPNDGKGSIKIDYTDYASLQRSVIINASGGTGGETPQLFEYLDTEDSAVGLNGVYCYWGAQTFTPPVAHKITSVKLKLHKTGSPGTITVSIRNTDVGGAPTGADISGCIGTTNGDTLTTVSPGEWREISFGNCCNLSASTKYAIVARTQNGGSSNWVYLRVKTLGDYLEGELQNSTDCGNSWSNFCPAPLAI